MSETKTTQTTSVGIPRVLASSERPSDGYVLARQVNSLELHSVQNGFTTAEIPFREEECEQDEDDYVQADTKIFVPKEYLKQSQKLMYTLLDFVPADFPAGDRPPEGQVLVRRVTEFELHVVRKKFKEGSIPFREKECDGDALDLGRPDTNIFVIPEHVQQARTLLNTMYPAYNYAPTKPPESDDTTVIKWMIPIAVIWLLTPWSDLPPVMAYCLGALLLAFPVGALIVYWAANSTPRR